MPADTDPARIASLECELFRLNSASGVMHTVQENMARAARVAELTRQVESLRSRQSMQLIQQRAFLAEIGGQRLSSGPLGRPEPGSADSWMSVSRDYDPMRRFLERDLRRDWDDWR